jgi:hypothetical protein
LLFVECAGAAGVLPSTSSALSIQNNPIYGGLQYKNRCII